MLFSYMFSSLQRGKCLWQHLNNGTFWNLNKSVEFLFIARALHFCPFIWIKSRDPVYLRCLKMLTLPITGMSTLPQVSAENTRKLFQPLSQTSRQFQRTASLIIITRIKITIFMLLISVFELQFKYMGETETHCTYCRDCSDDIWKLSVCLTRNFRETASFLFRYSLFLVS